MLQRSKSLAGDADVMSTEQEAGGFGQLLDLAVGFILRQYWTIVFATALATALGVIYLRVTPPTYTATASVLMRTERAQFPQQQAMLLDAPLDVAQLESQLQIIKSDAIASAVIAQLKLTEDPEFAPSGGPVRGVLSWFGGLFGKDSSNPTSNVAANEAVVTAGFVNRLTVNRVGLSYVVEIGFSSRSPERAAQIANAVANAYIADQLEAKYQANRTATGWLHDRLRELADQASTAERAVINYKAQNNIVATDGKLMDDQQIVDLNSRLVAARAQTSDVVARLNRVEEILSRGPDLNLDAVVPELAANPIITTLRQQYLELSRRHSEWAGRFGRDHLAVINLRNRMRDLQHSTFDELRRLAETYKSEYEIAKQRQDEVEKQLTQAVAQSRSTNKSQVTLRELETTAQGYRNLYESFLQRYMGSVQQETFPRAEARVISPATPLVGKSKPKTMLILALSMIGGVGLGVGIGLLRDLMDRVFRTGAQINATLQLPCIALVPLVKTGEPEPLALERMSDSDGGGGQLLARDASVFWTVVGSPLSRFAEAIRSIKLAINLHVTGRPNKVVGFTSSIPNEGKSTIAASLAHLIAQVGGRVILVDCDLRNPTLSNSLAPHATAGIVDVISGEKTLEEAIWRDPTMNLAFLPAVQTTPLVHTSEVLAADATKKLFDRLRASYDYVIVDLPPLAPIVDTRATTHLVDCFLLVVEWGRTKIGVVQHALSFAPDVHEGLIGVVLNKADMDFMNRYDVNTGDYYRNKHYARYGYTD